jgi:hypothetical protein
VVKLAVKLVSHLVVKLVSHLVVEQQVLFASTNLHDSLQRLWQQNAN